MVAPPRRRRTSPPRNRRQEDTMQAQAQPMDAPATKVIVREATPADADGCGRIFYDAFESIATRHNFPVEPGSPDFTRFLVGDMLANDGFAGLVAERGGEVLGSAFVDERVGDRRDRPGHRRPGGAGRRRRPGADGGGAAARARSRRGGHEARPDRLPLPVARALREARLRRPRAALGPAGNARRRSASPAWASGRRARTTLPRATSCARGSTGTTETASFATRSPPARAMIVERPGGISRLRDRVRLRLARGRRDQRPT